MYGGSPDNIHYSNLDQINRENVSKLQVAWTFDTGDAFEGSEMQCNPVIARGHMFVTSPKLRVFALDAATGKQIWVFDPNEGRKVTSKTRNRGLTNWDDGEHGRIYVASRHWLIALDAETGKPIPTFGDNGSIDLRENLGRDPKEMSISASTPGIVYKDLLILGSIVAESLPASPGYIRAYNLRSGKLAWIFHTIPNPGEPGYETWPKDAWTYTGGVNNWSGMTLDTKSGVVFVPTGSASADFYGANRIGDDLYANCLLALDAATGRLIWHFQFIHHDVWDRDLPTPPSLITIQRDGKMIDAVAQITKSGHLWVLDRATGKPLFPYKEVPIPASEVDGEVLAKTEPLPDQPPPFARQVFDESTVTDRTPEAHAAVLERVRKLRHGGQFEPPSFNGTIVFPGLDGGGEWGGPAYDPETGRLYVNANEFAFILRLVPRTIAARPSGKSVYLQNCISCHRSDMKGSPPEFPSLVAIGDKRTDSELRDIIREGAGRMPGFSQLSRPAMAALVEYLMTGKDVELSAADVASSPIELKYTLDGYVRFVDPDGYPAVKPPWGTLTAYDLDKGSIAWQKPLGEIPELAAKGLRNTGSENYGGGVVTKGGLFFIGATTHDRQFRVLDKITGETLWQYTLPAAGNATPAVYELAGRQYVAIAAGGGKWGERSAGTYVVFALPAAK